MPRKLTHKEYENKLFNIEADLYPIEEYQGNRVKILHECIEGHIVSIKPNAILDSGNGCSICAQRKKKTPTEYAEELRSRNIIPLEDYAGAHIKILHKCLVCNNTWITKPSHIVSLQKSGCPSCAKKFDANKPTKVYYVKISTSEDTYYKIGVTQKDNILNRFNRDKAKVSIKILHTWAFSTGYLALEYEKSILQIYERFRLDSSVSLLHTGNTELFSIDVLNLDKEKE
jgi:hypothetical protein